MYINICKKNCMRRKHQSSYWPAHRYRLYVYQLLFLSVPRRLLPGHGSCHSRHGRAIAAVLQLDLPPASQESIESSAPPSPPSAFDLPPGLHGSVTTSVSGKLHKRIAAQPIIIHHHGRSCSLKTLPSRSPETHLSKTLPTHPPACRFSCCAWDNSEVAPIGSNFATSWPIFCSPMPSCVIT